MSASFTPGPWVVDTDSIGHRKIRAETRRCVVSLDMRTTDGDARLIAAAPELYTALKACLGSFELAHSHKKLTTAADGGIVCACDLARAALAKVSE